MTLAEFILAIIGSNVITSIVTAWLQRRKSGAETNHTVVDTASDAIQMVKGAHGERLAELERQVKQLTRADEIKNQQIISMNRLIGELRMSAEIQSRSILETNDQMCLWRGRVSELLMVLRERQLPLPEWAALG